MSTIACVGSRETPPDVLEWMQSTGWEIARQGHTIVSGNAPGADQAWVRGANVVDATKVNLCLPWADFEAGAIRPGNVVDVLPECSRREFDGWTRTAATVHPRWGLLSPGAKALITRNVMIVSRAQLVLGWLNFSKVGGGGTGAAFRFARALKVPAVRVNLLARRQGITAALNKSKGKDIVQALIGGALG